MVQVIALDRLEILPVRFAGLLHAGLHTAMGAQLPGLIPVDFFWLDAHTAGIAEDHLVFQHPSQSFSAAVYETWYLWH